LSTNQRRKELREINKQKLQNIILTGTKICRKCKIEKDVSEFNRNYANKDSLNGWCKQCQSEANTARNKKIIHITTETKICSKCGIEKNVDEFYKSKNNEDGCHPWCKECDIKYAENYYIDNTIEVLKVHKLWQQANPEKYKQCIDAWYNSPAGKLSEKEAKKKRREIMKQLPNTFTKEEWEQCKEYFNYQCVYCGNENKEKFQRDHFISVLNYGPFTKENIVCSCPRCNSSKGDFDFFQWYPGQLFYSKEREEKILTYLGIIK
jgi:hypothetical protein